LRTRERRPDMFERLQLSVTDRMLLIQAEKDSPQSPIDTSAANG